MRSGSLGELVGDQEQAGYNLTGACPRLRAVDHLAAPDLADRLPAGDPSGDGALRDGVDDVAGDADVDGAGGHTAVLAPLPKPASI